MDTIISARGQYLAFLDVENSPATNRELEDKIHVRFHHLQRLGSFPTGVTAHNDPCFFLPNGSSLSIENSHFTFRTPHCLHLRDLTQSMIATDRHLLKLNHGLWPDPFVFLHRQGTLEESYEFTLHCDEEKVRHHPILKLYLAVRGLMLGPGNIHHGKPLTDPLISKDQLLFSRSIVNGQGGGYDPFSVKVSPIPFFQEEILETTICSSSQKRFRFTINGERNNDPNLTTLRFGLTRLVLSLIKHDIENNGYLTNAILDQGELNTAFHLPDLERLYVETATRVNPFRFENSLRNNVINPLNILEKIIYTACELKENQNPENQWVLEEAAQRVDDLRSHEKELFKKEGHLPSSIAYLAPTIEWAAKSHCLYSGVNRNTQQKIIRHSQDPKTFQKAAQIVEVLFNSINSLSVLLNGFPRENTLSCFLREQDDYWNFLNTPSSLPEGKYAEDTPPQNTTAPTRLEIIRHLHSQRAAMMVTEDEIGFAIPEGQAGRIRLPSYSATGLSPLQVEQILKTF